MRKVTHHELNECNNGIDIHVLDQPGSGGASHRYRVQRTELRVIGGESAPVVFADVKFQEGPISENGINGLTQEVLLAIVIDRLESFQKGPFANAHSQQALDYCNCALDVLHDRTRDRIKRDVEGKLEP